MPNWGKQAKDNACKRKKKLQSSKSREGKEAEKITWGLEDFYPTPV